MRIVQANVVVVVLQDLRQVPGVDAAIVSAGTKILLLKVLLKERMRQSVLGRHAIRHVEIEQSSEQVEAQVVNLGYLLAQVARALRQISVVVERFERNDRVDRPVGLARQAENLEDLVELVDVAVAHEEWAFEEELG